MGIKDRFRDPNKEYKQWLKDQAEIARIEKDLQKEKDKLNKRGTRLFHL